MLNAIYRLPKPLLASILIGGGIALILIKDPPHSFCDSQAAQFRKIRSGSTLQKRLSLCRTEGAPGSCYEYFSSVRQLLKDLLVLSPECAHLIYSSPEIKNSLASALTLMTALAWREDVLTGRVSKYNWLNRADLMLFCKIKDKYLLHYGQEDWSRLSAGILKLLPMKQKASPDLALRRSILSESCAVYGM